MTNIHAFSFLLKINLYNIFGSQFILVLSHLPIHMTPCSLACSLSLSLSPLPLSLPNKQANKKINRIKEKKQDRT